jgi:NADH-quinone oxidoreductase subunit M
MLSDTILSYITFLPLAGVVILLSIRGRDATSENLTRWVALVTSSVVFLLSLVMWAQFDPANPGFQFVQNYAWIGSSIGYRMGVDGISVLLVVLTALMMPICIVASWNSVHARVREYMIVFLVIDTLMLGTFATLDLAMFYVFFEGTLIPMFLIIGIWGGARRIQASYKFFFYTFAGSVLFLLGIMGVYWQAGTTDISKLLAFKFPADVQFWLWFAFFASFAVKLPMWPLHRWLPEAHVEAPTGGSVILAAILLKFGGYGFLRFSLSMFPIASHELANFVFVLSVAAIVVTSLVALVQEDMKKLIAYSSVAHMGFVTMGIFSGTINGAQGAVFQMVSHGLISAALFLVVGVVYDRLHTREISAYGGLVHRMPNYAAVFMVFTMANIGLPGTSGFVGEFLTLIGTFQVSTWTAVGATIGVILSAAYALRLYRRMIFGRLVKDSLSAIADLKWQEKAFFIPLAVLIVFFGFYPAPILRTTAASTQAIVALYHEAVGPQVPVVGATSPAATTAALAVSH